MINFGNFQFKKNIIFFKGDSHFRSATTETDLDSTMLPCKEDESRLKRCLVMKYIGVFHN